MHIHVFAILASDNSMRNTDGAIDQNIRQKKIVLSKMTDTKICFIQRSATTISFLKGRPELSSFHLVSLTFINQETPQLRGPRLTTDAVHTHVLALRPLVHLVALWQSHPVLVPFRRTPTGQVTFHQGFEEMRKRSLASMAVLAILVHVRPQKPSPGF